MSRLLRISLLVSFILGLLLFAVVNFVVGAYQAAMLEVKILLPLLMSHSNTGTRLDGTITKLGFPAVNEPVYLYLIEGDSQHQVDVSTTNTDGRYVFWSTPELTGKQMFKVVWLDSGTQDVSTLSYWYCNPILASAPYPYRQVCNFDIAGVSLISPGPSEIISLPYIFSWTDRGLGDNYKLKLHSMVSNEVLLLDAGSVPFYELTDLPATFRPGDYYFWMVWVSNENGMGVSTMMCFVAFEE